MFGRVPDGVDPALVDTATEIAQSVGGVDTVEGVLMRWHGHRMLITRVAAVDPDLSVREGHEIAQAVAHDEIHALPFTAEVLVHIDPSGDTGAHELTAHHS